MLYNDFNEKLLGLQDFQIEKVEIIENTLHIYGKMKRKEHICPHCSAKTDKVHDYREQIIKDIPAFGNLVYIHLKKRRYRCTCGKRFQEENTFLPRYYRLTNRIVAYVIKLLQTEVSYSRVAREVNLSVTKVISIFDLVSYSNHKQPITLSIDEFKGNSNSEKYQCILTDPVNKIVLDILPKRHESYLALYFSKYSEKQRSQVQYFVSDMWKPYSNISSAWFKNATQIVDKYHWIRQVIWAFESVRKQEQKKFSKSHRKYFKKSRTLLLKRFDSLNDEQKQQVNVMLYTSPTLSTAYYYKEDFLKILDCRDRDSAKKKMSEWINSAIDTDIPQLQKCANTMLNWLSGILNSFSSSVTNGFTEGCNNKIKVLKRNAYGYRNFNRFRNRILHIFSHQKTKQATA